MVFVEYVTDTKAEIVAAIYDKDDAQMLASGNLIVDAESSSAEVVIDGEVPEYFTSSAFLLDVDSHGALCDVFTTELQEGSIIKGIAGDLTWTLKDGVLRISGNGKMPDYDYDTERTPWYEERDSIKESRKKFIFMVINHTLNIMHLVELLLTSIIRKIMLSGITPAETILSETAPSGMEMGKTDEIILDSPEAFPVPQGEDTNTEESLQR